MSPVPWKKQASNSLPLSPLGAAQQEMNRMFNRNKIKVQAR